MVGKKLAKRFGRLKNNTYLCLMKTIKYIGPKEGFDKFVTDFIIKFNEKQKSGKFKDVFLFVLRTIKGVDVFQIILAQGKVNETLDDVGVRIGIYYKKTSEK